MIDIVIITGSNGFIGRHLTKKLKELGKFVIGIDIESNNDCVDCFYSCDVCDTPEFIFKDASVVYHLAGSAEPKICDSNPLETINTYVSGTTRILELANKYNCKVVVPSSIHLETYTGKPGDRNYPYLISKLTTDALCYYHKQNGTDVRLIRLSNVYGNNFNDTDTRVIPTLTRKILNNENISIQDDSRSFVDVNLVVEYIINGNEDVCLTSPEITIKDLVIKLQNVVKGEKFDENIIIS